MQKKNLIVLFILDLLDSSDVVVVLSQLLLVAQAIVPVTQLLVSGRKSATKSRQRWERLSAWIKLLSVCVFVMFVYVWFSYYYYYYFLQFSTIAWTVNNGWSETSLKTGYIYIKCGSSHLCYVMWWRLPQLNEWVRSYQCNQCVEHVYSKHLSTYVAGPIHCLFEDSYSEGGGIFSGPKWEMNETHDTVQMCLRNHSATAASQLLLLLSCSRCPSALEICLFLGCAILCVCVPIKVVREEAVALLDQTVPVEQLLIRLVLIPHWCCSGRHAVTTFVEKLPPVSAANTLVSLCAPGWCQVHG